MCIDNSLRASSRNIIVNAPQVNSFLNVCSQTSKNILTPTYQIADGRRRHYIGAVPITRYKIDRHAFSIDKDRKMNQSVRMAIGILGAIFGGYAIFKIREEFKQLKLADKELNKSMQFSKHIRQLKQQCPASDFHQQKVLEKLNDIADAHREIFQKIRRKANISIALLVAMAASAVVAVISSIFGSWAVASAALSGVLISGIILACKWLFDSADKGHKQNAKAINATLRELKEL